MQYRAVSRAARARELYASLLTNLPKPDAYRVFVSRDHGTDEREDPARESAVAGLTA
ncbi:hypothetical protein [Palleronia abyssalis]|uniref:hypothetical protein n=1 Tax=Palleronia abyssalis TaxID=1501240 RepID=UPI0015E82AA4|nr:hypothetical protein [Palleronia abyssalis]